MVEVRTRELLNAFIRNFEARGIDAAAYLQATGVTPQVLEQRLREEARSRSHASSCSRRSSTSSASR